MVHKLSTSNSDQEDLARFSYRNRTERFFTFADGFILDEEGIPAVALVESRNEGWLYRFKPHPKADSKILELFVTPTGRVCARVYTSPTHELGERKGDVCIDHVILQNRRIARPLSEHPDDNGRCLETRNVSPLFSRPIGKPSTPVFLGQRFKPLGLLACTRR